MHKNRIPEFRATPKSLAEQRADALSEMQSILDKAKEETRAMTDEETNRLDELEKNVSAIDKSMEKEKRALDVLKTAAPVETNDAEPDAEPAQKGDVPESEKRAFLRAVDNLMEKRTGEQNFDMGNNGAIISQSIAQRIITEVKEMCPILAGCTMYAVKGTLKVPVYGNKKIDGVDHNITVGYQTEFNEITADAGAFTSIDLTGYLCGALTLIGRSVITNSEIDAFDFIISEIAKRIALFIEKELLTGSGAANHHCTGALSTTNTINAESVSSISADKLIELQAKVPTVFQTNAGWTMHPTTFTALRKLKDSTGQYLLQQAGGITSEFPYTLLGKPVHLSDNMPVVASGAKAILYGDYSGLSVNMRENIEIQALYEKYATQHAIGLVAWFEMDSNITEPDKLAALVMSVTAG